MYRALIRLRHPLITLLPVLDPILQTYRAYDFIRRFFANASYILISSATCRKHVNTNCYRVRLGRIPVWSFFRLQRPRENNTIGMLNLMSFLTLQYRCWEMLNAAFNLKFKRSPTVVMWIGSSVWTYLEERGFRSPIMTRGNTPLLYGIRHIH